MSSKRTSFVESVIKKSYEEFCSKSPFLTFLKGLLSRELNEKFVRRVFARQILDLSWEGSHNLDKCQLLLLVHKKQKLQCFFFSWKKSKLFTTFLRVILKRSKTLVLSLRSTANVAGEPVESIKCVVGQYNLPVRSSRSLTFTVC